MKVYRGFEDLPHLNGAVATMGSFDGVHSAHRELLRRVKGLAEQSRTQSVVLTFEPHPRYVLSDDCDMLLLSTLEEKLWLLEREGVDCVVVIPFDKQFSQTPPQEFIDRYIIPAGIGTMVVGYNHHFGHNKQGDYDLLQTKAGGLRIHRVEQQLLLDSKISSTVIRRTIADGDMKQARELLSHPYIIKATLTKNGVIMGIDPKKQLPKSGKYSARVAQVGVDLEIGENQSISIAEEYRQRIGEIIEQGEAAQVMVEL